MEHVSLSFVPNDLCPKMVFGEGEGREGVVYLGDYLAGCIVRVLLWYLIPNFTKLL